MGNQVAQHAAVDLDDDLLTRASDLLKEAHARKRSRDDEPAAPAPMFSLPKPSLPDVGAAVGGDEYTSAVLAAATAYINSGGKACKPIESASAGSIGRKSQVAYEPSDSSAATHASPSPRTSLVPPPGPPQLALGVAEADVSADEGATFRRQSNKAVVYKCRRCGCSKRSHVCVATAAHAEAPIGAHADQRLRPWTVAEDEVICSGVKEHGYKWSLISTRLEGRTDNAVRNRWHRLEAARKWRMERTSSHQQGAVDAPGYKCGRCGQPKRGHACPYGPEPSRTAQPAGAGDDESDVVSDAELAALFASLEACPAADAGEEDDLHEADMCGLVEAIVNDEDIEEILSSASPTSDAHSAGTDNGSTAAPSAEWHAAHAIAHDSAAWFHEAGLSSSGLAEEDDLGASADGAVCF